MPKLSLKLTLLLSSTWSLVYQWVQHCSDQVHPAYLLQENSSLQLAGGIRELALVSLQIVQSLSLDSHKLTVLE